MIAPPDLQTNIRWEHRESIVGGTLVGGDVPVRTFLVDGREVSEGEYRVAEQRAEQWVSERAAEQARLAAANTAAAVDAERRVAEDADAAERERRAALDTLGQKLGLTDEELVLLAKVVGGQQ